MKTAVHVRPPYARIPCTRITPARRGAKQGVFIHSLFQVWRFLMIPRVFTHRAIRRSTAVALTAGLLFHSAAWSRLPDISALGAPTDNNYITTILFVVGLGIGAAALILGGSAFLEVAGGIIAKFNEWRTGRAEAGDLKKVIVGGAAVLAIVILLATVAISVINSSSTITG